MPENNSFMKWFKGLNTGEKIAFWVGVITLIGVLLTAYSVFRTEQKQNPLHQDSTFLAEQLYSDLCKANEDNCRLREGLHSKEDEIASLKDIIEDLRKPRKTQEETDLATKAEIELAKGNVEAAKGFYADEAKRNLKASDESRLKAAENYRRIGALDFMNNPKEAVKAYEKSVELDPKSAIGWNRLGILYKMFGNMKSAEDAFNEVLRLSNSDKRIESVAYSNLGLIRKAQGDLGAAEEFQLKALEIDKELGSKEGMAADYGNLGVIRQTQGDLEGAEEFYNKALKIGKELGSKERIAIQYGNLGVIRDTQGDLEGAEDYWQQSLALYKQIGAAPMIEKIQGWLDELEANKDN